MLINVLLFSVALILVVRGSTLATTHAAALAEHLRMSKYTVGFLIIAIISILPEAMIAVSAAFNGTPSFGLGTLLGSNVADLTLIFALLILLTKRGLVVEQKILKNHVLYPFILLLPIILGLDGHFTRIEGAGLVLAGILFYYRSLRGEIQEDIHTKKKGKVAKNVFILLLSLTMLLVGSHFVVESATTIATIWNVSAVIIGLVIVGLGTVMPEFFFALNAVRRNDDSLAIGDILGTVLSDATIVIGILALISPFYFPQTMIYVGGVFMVIAACILFIFMRSGKVVTRSEAFALFLFWVTFILVEVIVVV